MKKIKPYLIQRANQRKDNYYNGIDSVIKIDYMGSAEFEFGALPESLKRIRENFSNYSLVTIDFAGKEITVFFNSKEFELSDIREMLHKLSKNEFHLQEYSDFNNFIYHNDRCYTNFWWDILHDIMWWKYDKEFNLSFKTVIKK